MKEKEEGIVSEGKEIQVSYEKEKEQSFHKYGKKHEFQC